MIAALSLPLVLWGYHFSCCFFLLFGLLFLFPTSFSVHWSSDLDATIHYTTNCESIIMCFSFPDYCCKNVVDDDNITNPEVQTLGLKYRRKTSYIVWCSLYLGINQLFSLSRGEPTAISSNIKFDATWQGLLSLGTAADAFYHLFCILLISTKICIKVIIPLLLLWYHCFMYDRNDFDCYYLTRFYFLLY